MIDFGLLMSLILGFGIPALLVWWWPLEPFGESVGFLDVALGPAFAGVAVGRLVALAFDDPGSLTQPKSILIIRSGVEFWPGVLAGVAMLVWLALRAGRPRWAGVIVMTPFALASYASYEAACVFRDGCFGPDSPVGLTPPGLSTTMFPIGPMVAIVVALTAWWAHRALSTQGWRVVAVAVAVVAGARSVASFWLPRVGDGLTRQHLTSVVVFVVALGVVGVAAMRGLRSDIALPHLGGQVEPVEASQPGELGDDRGDADHRRTERD